MSSWNALPRLRSTGLRCGPLAICSILVGCFLGQPKYAQARRFLSLGLPWGVGLSFGIDLLYRLELLLRTPTARLARHGLGMHWHGLLSTGGRFHRPTPRQTFHQSLCINGRSDGVSKLILKRIYEETKIIDTRKIITYFFRFRNLLVKFDIDTILDNLDCKRLAGMYISLADSRAKGFEKNGPTFTSRRS